MKVILSLIGLSCGIVGLAFTKDNMPEDSVSLGRQIYIAEGCINCHSQYSRPDTADAFIFGPSISSNTTPDSPVLIGNRRQGPDLSNVGARRSREWNRQHLMHPQAISNGSRMPEYDYLFSPGHRQNGEALLDYLESLVVENTEDWWRTIYQWSPEISTPGNQLRGAKLFQTNCTQCHGVNGRGNGTAHIQFTHQPLDLVAGDYRFAPGIMDSSQRKTRIAQIIKYGQPGTDMPGHEYLTDQNVVDLMTYLDSLSGEEYE
jgi:cytochrome c2